MVSKSFRVIEDDRLFGGKSRRMDTQEGGMRLFVAKGLRGGTTVYVSS